MRFSHGTFVGSVSSRPFEPGSTQVRQVLGEPAAKVEPTAHAIPFAALAGREARAVRVREAGSTLSGRAPSPEAIPSFRARGTDTVPGPCRRGRGSSFAAQQAGGRRPAGPPVACEQARPEVAHSREHQKVCRSLRLLRRGLRHPSRKLHRWLGGPSTFTGAYPVRRSPLAMREFLPSCSHPAYRRSGGRQPLRGCQWLLQEVPAGGVGRPGIAGRGGLLPALSGDASSLPALRGVETLVRPLFCAPLCPYEQARLRLLPTGAWKPAVSALWSLFGTAVHRKYRRAAQRG